VLRHGSHSFYLQITLCLPLLRKCSPDSASPDWGCRHLIVCLSILQSLLSVVAVSSSTRSVQHQEGYLACIYCLAVLKGLHRERWDSMGWSQVNLGWPQVNLGRSQVNLPDPRSTWPDPRSTLIDLRSTWADPRSTCLTPGKPGLIPGKPGQYLLCLIPQLLCWLNFGGCLVPVASGGFSSILGSCCKNISKLYSRSVER